MRGSFKFKLDWSTSAGPICLNPDRPPCLSLSLPNDFCPARNVTETMKDGISAASAREANCLPPVPLIERYIGGFGEKSESGGRRPSLRPSFFCSKPITLLDLNLVDFWAVTWLLRDIQGFPTPYQTVDQISEKRIRLSGSWRNH